MATQNFVIAFGGTGARVLEALGYLYAARVLRSPANLLMIDPDAQNGNVGIARSQLQRYHEVHGHVELPKDGVQGARPFFATPLNDEKGLEGFAWRYPNPNQSFGTLIGYASQERPHQNLLDLLFDEGDLDLHFERGYVGHAHIGSLDLVRTLKRAIEAAANDEDKGDRDALQLFFRALRAAALGGTARLFVMGSVFGGTGASGIPAIPTLINETLREIRDKIKLGCIQMGPYFSFPTSDRERAPNSVNHPLATQAALYHYAATETGYDRIYFAGSPTAKPTNTQHSLGGRDQTNRAHYAELVGALAAADFLEGALPAGNTTEVLSSGATGVDWHKLPFARTLELRRNLTSFATFCQLYADFIADDLAKSYHRGARWTVELKKETQRTLGGSEAELIALKEFAARFLEWVIEIQDSAGGGLFAVLPSDRRNAAALATVAGGGRVAVGSKIRFPFPIRHDGDGNDAYHSLMERLNRDRRVGQSSPSGWMLAAVTQSVDEFCAVNYNSWWKNDEQ